MPKNIAKNVFEKLTDQASSAGKALVKEPGNIISNSLNLSKPNEKPTDQSIEQPSSSSKSHKTSNNQQTTLNSNSLLVKKKQDELETSQALAKLHQQRIQEEESYAEKQASLDQKKQQEDLENQKNQEIIQLEHRKAQQKQETLQAQNQPPKGPRGLKGIFKTKKLQGTKESSKLKD